MNCKTPALLAFLFAIAAPFGTHAQSSKVPADVAALAAHGPVRVIVTLTTPTSPEVALDAAGVWRQRAAVTNAQEAVIGSLAQRADVLNLDILPGFAVTTDAIGLAQLSANPAVAAIVNDTIALVEPWSGQTDLPSMAAETNVVRGGALDFTPTLLQANRLWANGTQGETWSVAVVGSGVDVNHSFFSGRVTAQACFSSNFCPDGAAAAFGHPAGEACTDDQCQSGTRIAGVVMGKTIEENSLSGIAPRAGLIAIKVYSRLRGAECGSTSDTVTCLGFRWSDAIAALGHVETLAGSMRVAAVHFTPFFFLNPITTPSPGFCDARKPELAIFKTAVDRLRAAGIPTVVGSGENTLRDEPGCISTVIAVGSSSKSPEVFQGYSNRQAQLLVAPGENILTSDLSQPGYTSPFGSFSNTSLAAAHVAGAWALLKTIFPTVSVDTAMLAFQRTGVPLYDALTLRNFPRIVADKAAGSMGPAGSPTSVTATAVGTNATIAWANPFNGSVPSGFRVEFAAWENGGHLYGAINVGATYSFVTTLPQGRYLVRVRALNAGGAPGAASNDVRLIVGLPPISDPPLPPDGFRAVVDGQTVQLYWNLRQDSAPATGYLIDASSIPNFTTNFGTFDTNSSERSFVFRNVQPGTYFARVRARNQFGASGPSNEITINVGGSSCGQLVAPTGLNATVVGRLVTLNWNPPVLPGAILGYIVEAGTAPGLSDVVAANIPNQTAVSANNVAPGRYYVRVRARTANCGTTPASPDVTVVVP